MNGPPLTSPVAAATPLRSAHEVISVVPFAALGDAIIAGRYSPDGVRLGGTPFTTAEGELRRLAWLVHSRNAGPALRIWASASDLCLDCTAIWKPLALDVLPKGLRGGVRHRTTLVSIPTDRMTGVGQSWDMHPPREASKAVKARWVARVTTGNPWAGSPTDFTPGERRIVESWTPGGITIPHISGEALDQLARGGDHYDPGKFLAPILDDFFDGIVSRRLRDDFTL